MFAEGDDVLMRGPDGLLYLGVVVDVEDQSFLIRFGDSTEKWAPLGQLRRLGASATPAPCSPAPSCVTQPSRTPTPPPPVLKPFDGIEVPYHVLRARKELPYDFDSLLWDENHQRNDKEKYCYCGESGDWYKRMLQCNRCSQWFHQECIRTPAMPQLLFGDRFFEFVCTLCTGTSEEILRRLTPSWADALHLVLFNLTVINNKKFHDLESAIIPFFKRRLKLLSGPGSGLKSSRIEPHYIGDLLISNKSRFRCGSEINFWGLRKMVPPPAAAAPAGKKQRQVIVPSIRRRPAAKSTRPRVGPRDSVDSSCCGDSSDATSSSRGTLDSFIPPPKDFEGGNNPFRGLVARASARACSDGLFLRPFKRRRKRVVDQASLDSAGNSPHSSISGADSTSAMDIDVAAPLPDVNVGDDSKKFSLSSCFGVGRRMAKGDKFEVVARRLNLDGDIQYLMAWEEPMSKTILASLTDGAVT